MATFTASQNESEVRATHIGVNVVLARADIATTGTASSVVLLVKVPNKAVIVDYMWCVDDGGADNTWDLGFANPAAGSTLTQSSLRSALSSTAGTHVNGSNPTLPYRISLSDDAVQQWIWVAATCAVAISASAHHKFTLFYTMGETA